MTPEREEFVRMKAYEMLGIDEDEMHEEEPWFIKSLRLPKCILGRYRNCILDVCVEIAKKKYRVCVEREPPYYPCFRNLVESGIWFECFTGILIISNGICIGMETNIKDGEERPLYLELLEYFFVTVFIIEITFRLLASEGMWIFNLYNLADTSLIFVTGILPVFILTPLGINHGVMTRGACLRIVRLARLFNIVRMVPFCSTGWILMHGVISCVPTLISAGTIIASVLFVFAVAMINFVGKKEEYVDDPRVQGLFGDLNSAMFSLFQCMTMDSWGSMMRDILLDDMASLMVYSLFTGVAGIALFELMTAIVVNQVIEEQKNDVEAVSTQKKAKDKKMRRELMDIFEEMDEDKSGELSKEEFTDVLDDVGFVRKMKMLDIDLEELPDTYEILDDGDGKLESEEFIRGLMTMQGPAMSREMLRATKRMMQQSEDVEQVYQCLQNGAGCRLDIIEGNLDRARKNFLEMQQMTAEILHRMDRIGVRKVARASLSQIPSIMEPRPTGVSRANNINTVDQFNTDPEPDPWQKKLGIAPIPENWMIRKREDLKKDAKEKGKLKGGKANKEKNSNEIETEEESDGEPPSDYVHMLKKLDMDQTTFDKLRTAAKIPKTELMKEPRSLQLMPSKLTEAIYKKMPALAKKAEAASAFDVPDGEPPSLPNVPANKAT